MVNWNDFVTPTDNADDRVDVKMAAVGDTISGKFRSVQILDTTFGRKPLVKFDGSDVDTREAKLTGASVSIWATPGFLRALADIGIDEGEAVKITLTELRDTGKGNPAKIYDADRIGGSDPFGD